MRWRINNLRDVWIFTGMVCLLSVVCSELTVLTLYLVGGREAFHFDNAVMFAALVPVLVSVPITYWVAKMSLSLSSTQAELQQLANTDPLTRLSNRRAFFRTAEAMLRTAETQNRFCALMVIDADYFKDINDSYGHAIGDKALVGIADVLRDNFRQTDLICRVGGEEFAVLLPGLDVSRAEPLAQRVVNAVSQSPITEDNIIIEYSVSCGIADTTTSYQLQALFKEADDAMYLAKERGRNRVARRDEAA